MKLVETNETAEARIVSNWLIENLNTIYISAPIAPKGIR